jgi:hypothetical protein
LSDPACRPCNSCSARRKTENIPQSGNDCRVLPPQDDWRVGWHCTRAGGGLMDSPCTGSAQRNAAFNLPSLASSRQSALMGRPGLDRRKDALTVPRQAGERFHRCFTKRLGVRWQDEVAVPQLRLGERGSCMLSPKRLVAVLVVLGYGAVPMGTGACDFGPDFKCSKQGQTCGGFISGCCDGLDCDSGTNKCVLTSSARDTVVRDTLGRQRQDSSK